ncbi:autotransporter outer membrane beta-barrel domain-containing protein [Morganella morganii subsp. morganii]|uniref:autotransporter outer membrane beta-barrel domain-containing protein n=1 Tax=Morganella morganii TaxID=582 RepID=UPI001BD994D0|nr:autotransporter outer membrane beta-barrel domain-containing protein [Morganella morganii]MBT0379767.1 autotransporter outer membrane beta-barrel domain-containing protein [Morganella morganii subsp. morganii]
MEGTAGELIFYDAFTGNTLNFSAAPVTLSGTVANFENYNFIVDPALVNTSTALITAKDITFGTNETNMKGGNADTSIIQVVGIKSGDELFADDKFVLMQATGNMSGEAEGLTTKGIAQQGISLLYDVRTDVDTDGKLVTATILGNDKLVDPVDPVDPVEPPIDPEKPVESGKPAAKVNQQLKALSEGHLASAMMLTRGADTLAYNTVHAIQHQNPEKGLVPFITLSGDKTRYNSGSHINAGDGLLTGGLSWQTDKLVSAVLVESGWGSYNTHNDFNNMKDVNGDDHNRYVGAAILGHYDFDSGVFAEASLRAGKNHNTFDTKDIQNLSTGEYAHYNLDSNYLGAHIGTGYSKALDEKNTADVSAKYLWTQLKGKDVNVAGDTIHFDDINSHCVRVDAGLSHQYTEAVAVRAGLGYEYEFDGKAKAATYGYDIAAPGVQGSTGILTLGSTITPLTGQPLSVEMNLNGYTGKRDGVGGSIKFSYVF